MRDLKVDTNLPVSPIGVMPSDAHVQPTCTADQTATSSGASRPRLATMTPVNVLKGQGLYHQALEVLDILEEKGEDKKRIDGERKAIKAEL